MAELARAYRREKRERRTVLAGQLVLFALLMGSWSLVSGRLVDPIFLSDPESVATAFWTLLIDGSLLFHLRFTLVEMTLGYALGASSGVLAAVLISALPGAEAVARPFALAGYGVPKIALAPLLIAWFGIGILPKVVLAATMVFFIVYFTTLSGIASIDPELRATIRVMSPSRAAVLLKLTLPSTVPYIATALRISLPAALIGAIIGELLSSNRGVGYLISAASTRYDAAQVFAGIASLLLFVLLMNAIVSLLERSLLRWRPKLSGAME
ncbi:MAG: ABC transporter permease [Vicinamibacteria bacterium]